MTSATSAREGPTIDEKKAGGAPVQECTTKPPQATAPVAATNHDDGTVARSPADALRDRIVAAIDGWRSRGVR